MTALRTYWSRLSPHIVPVLRLNRLHRPTDLGLLALMALWGLWLGGKGEVATGKLLLLLLSILLVRGLAWLVHDIVIGRLANRQHTLKKLLLAMPLTIRWFGAAQLFGALLFLLLLGWPTLLAVACAALLGMAYLLLRRRTFLGELLLALVLAAATIAGFTASGVVPNKTAWLVYTAAVLWSGAFLTQYSALHLQQHARVGIKSITMLLGRADRWLVLALHSAALIALLLAGRLEQLGIFLKIGVTVAAALALFQQWLMNDASEASYRRAYLNNLWFGLALFCGVLFHYLCKAQVTA